MIQARHIHTTYLKNLVFPRLRKDLGRSREIYNWRFNEDLFSPVLNLRGFPPPYRQGRTLGYYIPQIFCLWTSRLFLFLFFCGVQLLKSWLAHLNPNGACSKALTDVLPRLQVQPWISCSFKVSSRHWKVVRHRNNARNFCFRNLPVKLFYSLFSFLVSILFVLNTKDATKPWLYISTTDPRHSTSFDPSSTCKFSATHLILLRTKLSRHLKLDYQNEHLRWSQSSPKVLWLCQVCLLARSCSRVH